MLSPWSVPSHTHERVVIDLAMQASDLPLCVHFRASMRSLACSEEISAGPLTNPRCTLMLSFGENVPYSDHPFLLVYF